MGSGFTSMAPWHSDITVSASLISKAATNRWCGVMESWRWSSTEKSITTPILPKNCGEKGWNCEREVIPEVILAAYRQWGTDCLSRFIGMFAFALWDSREETVWVVRDRMGVKPLYFWSENGRFACASEIGPLLELGLQRAELNEKALDAFFTLGYVPSPETMFRGIYKLEPGHFLRVNSEGVFDTLYWDFADAGLHPIQESDAIDLVDSILEDAVRRCLVSDVSLGTFLSGGLDSSAVVGLMSRCGIQPIHTFTSGFAGDDEISEERWANLVAKRFNCDHTVEHLAAEDFWESLETLIKHTEEPLVEPSGVALYSLSKAARSKVKVLLSGEGSDEIFGGYTLYRRMMTMESLHQRFPRFINCRIPRRLGGDAALKYWDWINLPLDARYRGTSALLTDRLRDHFYDPEFRRGAGTYLDECFQSHFDRTSSDLDPLSRMLYVDARTWLVDDLLLKADKMTMAASVELRVPFLDHRVVELASRIPTNLKIKGREGKWILKKVMESQLPPEVVWRSKMGFPVPIKKWFGGELRQSLRERLLDRDGLPWVRQAAIEDLIENDRLRSESNTRFLMTLAVLENWQRRYLG